MNWSLDWISQSNSSQDGREPSNLAACFGTGPLVPSTGRIKMNNMLRIVAATLLFGSAAWTTAPAMAQDEVQLLPPGLMAPSSKEIVPAGKFEKKAPWVIGMSWPGVGNTWIVQTIQEIKYAASHNPNIKDFRFSEANWQPAKQVSDIEDLMAHKVDALIIAPIAVDLVKSEVDAAAKAGIPSSFSARAARLRTRPCPSMAAARHSGGRWRIPASEAAWQRHDLGVPRRCGSWRRGFPLQRPEGGAQGQRHQDRCRSLRRLELCQGQAALRELVASGKPVDGIWFSGADMTRACFDVFKELGKSNMYWNQNRHITSQPPLQLQDRKQVPAPAARKPYADLASRTPTPPRSSNAVSRTI